MARRPITYAHRLILKRPPAVTNRLVRDMALTETEFLARLPQAILWSQKNGDGGNNLAFSLEDAIFRVTWRLLPSRKIALLELPRLEVTLIFENCDAPTQAALLDRFDRVFQKGGG